VSSEGAPAPQPHDKERDMAQELLLDKLEEAATKTRLLEREKAAAVARIQTLEREVGELKDLISLAESKADEMLEGGSAPDASRDSEPPASKVSAKLPPLPESEQEELKRRFPHAFKQNLF